MSDKVGGQLGGVRMSNQPAVKAQAVTLAIRKGSIVAPLLLLLLTIFLFVVYALPSEHAELARKLKLTKLDPTAKDIITRFSEVYGSTNQALRDEIWSANKLNPWTYVTDILRPLFKAYLEQLIDDFRLIVVSFVGTVSILALYALIPGLAGLIYRRQFTIWFLASFAVLLAINSSGIFKSLSGGGEPMPGSGLLLIFLISQILILILAFRLRRQTSSVRRVSPAVHNWLLKGALVGSGIALWQLWMPYGSGEADKVAKPAAMATPAPKVPGADVEAFRDCPDTRCPALVRIAGATFTMGSPPPPPDQATSSRGIQRMRESPVHTVTVKTFWIGRYEVTNEEWAACVAAKACVELKRPEFMTGRHPVAGVSYEEAKQYAAWLSARLKQTYRLPSESEWELAARAGTQTTFAHGDHEDGSYGWTARDFPISRDAKPQPVGTKKPNPLGLYDMQGNVEEWVGDCWFESYAGHPTDGSARTDCTNASPAGARIARGGASFYMQYHDTRPRHRIWAQSGRAAWRGLRLVREEIATGGPVHPVAALGPISVATASPKKPATGMRGDGGMKAFVTTGFTGWVFKLELILVGLPLIYSLLRNSAAWTERKRKNIVICLDGTSNTPDQIDHGFAATTNVYKLFRMLKSDAEGIFQPGDKFDASLCKRYRNGEAQQIAFYYAGVGNKYDNDPILQTLGMAAGAGAADMVERAYQDLVRVYQKGDRVFIFGFSRGAAISRLLARAIDARGAPRSVWTIRLFGKHRTLWASKSKQPVAIDVLGCWDTVGSFGVAKTIAGINFQQLNVGRDLSVPENVQQAYHMVSLDEQRDSFEPTLMDPDPNRPERIVEVWFAGDHANVGGGWATDRLSDITLDFLLNRISSGYANSADLAGQDESWGLYLKAWKADKADYWERQDDNPHIVDPDPLGQIQQWFSHLYQYRPRKLPQHAVISDTVFNRMVDALPLYAPQALFNLNDELDRRRDLIAEQVAKLQETKLLSDEDLKKIEGYKAKLRLNRFEDYWDNKILPARKGRFKPPAEALANAIAPPKEMQAA